MEVDLTEEKIGSFDGGTITLNLEGTTQLILQQQELQGGALPSGTYQIVTQDGIQITDNSLTITEENFAQILGVQKSELVEQPSSSNAEKVTSAADLNSTSSGVHDGAGETTGDKEGGILSETPAVEARGAAPGEGHAAGASEKEETSQDGGVTTIHWVSKDYTSTGEPVKIISESTGTGNNGKTQDTNQDSEKLSIHPETSLSSTQPIKDVHVIIEQEAPPTDTTPTHGAALDLSKPIEVTNETIVIIDGKKCVLSANPDTGQLCAYPVLTQEGKRKRGRPPNSQRKNQVPFSKKTRKKDPVLIENYIEQTNAAEGLLELSNTGPDGVRRSGRSRKKAKLLDDYEVTEVNSDEESVEVKEERVDDAEFSLPGTRRVKVVDSMEVSPVTWATATTQSKLFTPQGTVKRGRGRPRRYPPPGQSSLPTQIPAVIIPGSNGPTIMMAPVQGISNMNAIAEQIKNLPSIVSTKVVSPLAPKPTTSVPIAVSVVGSGTPNTSGIITIGSTASTTQTSVVPALSIDNTGGPGLSAAPGVVLRSIITSQATSNADTLSISQSVSDSVPSETLPAITMESDEINSKEPLRLSMTEDETLDLSEASDSTDQLSEVKQGEKREEASEESTKGNIIKPVDDPDQQTIIRIPENLLPLFMPKKDPVKLGLKLKFNDQELQNMKCPKCDFQAFYPQQYQSHIATHPEEIQKCKCCNFVSFDSESLLSHFKENHPRCICNVCNFMAEHAYIIKRHMMRHNMEGCTCQMCGKVYKDQYILKMHVKMVHMPAEVLFECTVCSKKFTRKAHLKRHLRIHEPEKPYKCPHCDYRGCEKSDISKHVLIHEEPKHVCEVCGKAFRHIKNKELHLKRHNGQKDYKCGVCEFYGYTFTDIRKHIERKHSDVKTHVCEKCGTLFKSEALLKEHYKTGCVFMIEQALAIATSTGGTSQATIQIPSNSLSVDNEFISKQANSGAVNTITVEQVALGEAITLSEEHIQAGLRDGSLRSLDEGHVEVISHGHIIEDGQVMSEEEPEEGAEEEEEEEMIAMEHLSDSVVEEELSVGEDLDMQITD